MVSWYPPGALLILPGLGIGVKGSISLWRLINTQHMTTSNLQSTPIFDAVVTTHAAGEVFLLYMHSATTHAHRRSAFRNRCSVIDILNLSHFLVARG